MFREITIYDIAEALNLSAATVSRALKDHPAIHKDTKKLVREKAEEMGYRFNAFASNLRRKRTNTIGVIVPRLNSNFMSSVLSAMEWVANEAGYNLVITQSQESVQKEIANTLTLFNSRVDGLLVSLASDTADYRHFNRFIDRRIPLLFFDRVPDEAFSRASVVIDNLEAGREATLHLIGQGCRRIMHVTGDLKRNVYQDRYEGFRQAMIQNGLEVPADGLVINDLSVSAGEQVAMQIHQMGEKPDGIFIANDLCAVSFMKAFRELGYAIPEDIAVVGFNDDPVSRFIEPELTTIRYSGTEVGEVALKTLLQTLDNELSPDELSKTLLPHKLVVRQSSLKKKIAVTE